MTLNSGFYHPEHSPKNINDEEKNLIREFIRNVGVTQCPPSGVQGNEVSPVTHEYIMKLRRDYRAAQRAKAKAK